MMSLPEIGTIDVGRLTLAYRESGRGGPLLLLHGIGSNSKSWVRQFEGFAARYRVIAWDTPGYGNSSPMESDPPPRIENYADALDGFMAALGIDSAHVAGHSMGGAIACVFAARYPRRVRGLVLADSTRGGGVRPERERKARLQARLAALDDLGPGGMAKERAPRLVSRSAPPGLVRQVEDVMAEVRPEGYRPAAVMLSEADTVAALKTVGAPTLVLCGEYDEITPVEESRAICALLPDGTLEIIPGAGHASHLEQPESYNELILAFLASVEQALPPSR
jgi:pimeloyl-ACP methyl ester carboxylesterase